MAHCHVQFHRELCLESHVTQSTFKHRNIGMQLTRVVFQVPVESSFRFESRRAHITFEIADFSMPIAFVSLQVCLCFKLGPADPTLPVPFVGVFEPGMTDQLVFRLELGLTLGAAEVPNLGMFRVDVFLKDELDFEFSVADIALELAIAGMFQHLVNADVRTVHECRSA